MVFSSLFSLFCFTFMKLNTLQLKHAGSPWSECEPEIWLQLNGLKLLWASSWRGTGGSGANINNHSQVILVVGKWVKLPQNILPKGTYVENITCVIRQLPRYSLNSHLWVSLVLRHIITYEPYFKMHSEIWANNVNDIQWDCQMLVIYFHFHINVGPPVMNWKLNKHISFN